MHSKRDVISPKTGRSKNAPTVGEIIGQQEGSYGFQDKNSHGF